MKLHGVLQWLSAHAWFCDVLHAMRSLADDENCKLQNILISENGVTMEFVFVFTIADVGKHGQLWLNYGM